MYNLANTLSIIASVATIATCATTLWAVVKDHADDKRDDDLT